MHFLAIYEEDKILKIALVSKDKKRVTMELVRSLSSDVKPLYILKPILANKHYEIATGLHPEHTLLRCFPLNLSKRKDIIAALPFQIESIIPHPPEETVALSFIEDAPTMRVLASSKKQIADHLERMLALEVDPDRVSCAPVALFRIARYYYPERADIAALHLGDEENLFVSIAQGKMVFAHVFKVASKGDLENQLERLKAFLEKKEIPLPNYLLVTGKYQDISPFTRYWKEVLEIPKEESAHALAIGIALDAAAQDSHSAQFREGMFTPKKQTVQTRKSLLTYVTLSLVATCMLWGAHTALMLFKEKNILRHLGISEPQSVQALLTQWQKKSSRKKTSSPPILATLSVSQALAYLSAHPSLEGSELTAFHYHLESPSAARVELELITSSPQQAEAFHASLLADRSFVNTEKEVLWTPLDTGYKASFYLKYE